MPDKQQIKRVYEANDSSEIAYLFYFGLNLSLWNV